jgi:signal transduction histidine kinase
MTITSASARSTTSTDSSDEPLMSREHPEGPTEDGAPRSSRGRRLAWAALGIIVALAVVEFTLAMLSGSSAELGPDLLYATFPIVGAVLATKRPGNSIGWLMLAIGFVFVLPLQQYAEYALRVRHGAWPAAPYALTLSGPSWVPFVATAAFMMLLFPDGHLPSRRWRLPAWICGIGMGSVFVLILCWPGRFVEAGFPRVRNPLGIEGLRPFLGSAPTVIGVITLATILLGGVGIIVRWRTARGDVERHQIRWLAWTAAVIAALYVLDSVPLPSEWRGIFSAASGGALALIPVSIGIAILRYHLFDIDVVIRKTLVVGVLAAFFVLVYALVVGGVGAMVGASSSTALSFVAAVVAAVLFQPVLTRARRFADRTVYGARATPYEVLTEFSDRLAETYAAEEVLPRMARILGQGVGATRARVWLHSGTELRPVATWPEGAETQSPDDARTDVRHRGERLGAISVRLPASDPMDPSKEKLMSDLAAQAGIVLRNVRLVEDIRASQRRLVAAQDEERRRLERNIHDGAQQQLVALAVRAGLARRLTESEPRNAAVMLEGIEADAQHTLDDLRDLARGIYPPLLADKGLVAALRSQASKSPVRVDLEGEGVGRYAQPVESAVYFAVLEALQNVAKYAGATRAEVRLEASSRTLTFLVRDDGRGFDPAATRHGTGLQGIDDRLAALDGSVHVDSAAGKGTTITGMLPVGDDASSGFVGAQPASSAGNAPS